MAASYSSFLTSPYYSPVFNTALFDGAFRIYFSQSYESTALKIYHIIQSDHKSLWNKYKKWSEQTRKNVFILVYPSKEDVGIAFSDTADTPIFSDWDEGLIIGIENTSENQEAHFDFLLSIVIDQLKAFVSEKEHMGRADHEITS